MSPFLTDEAIEALVQGDVPATAELAPLHTFAQQVRTAGERPAPVPSAALAAVLAGDGVVAAAEGVVVVGPWDRARETVGSGWSGVVAKVAGLGLVAKLALGGGVAAATMAGASAVGVLPEPVDNAVHRVVEAVTPIEFDDGDDDAPAVRHEPPFSDEPPETVETTVPGVDPVPPEVVPDPGIPETVPPSDHSDGPATTEHEGSVTPATEPEPEPEATVPEEPAPTPVPETPPSTDPPRGPPSSNPGQGPPDDRGPPDDPGNGPPEGRGQPESRGDDPLDETEAPPTTDVTGPQVGDGGEASGD